MSTLKYYAKTNIGSRPSKGEVRKLDFKDLRAFVGSWSQLKNKILDFLGRHCKETF
jgi:phosphoenolpyruvate carboxylase